MKSDSELKSDVLAELKWDPRIRSNEIGVTVRDGAVTLTGVVGTYSKKLAAERAVKRVKGVRAIAEEIEVKLPAQMRTSDEGIAGRIANILEWDNALHDSNIQAEVSKGHVTLTGEVDWLYQRQTAGRRAQELQGVTSVSNKVTIRPRKHPVAPEDIEKNIMAALHRHANIEASKISVSVIDGKVALNGVVDALFELELVQDAVWATSGVKEVADHLTIR